MAAIVRRVVFTAVLLLSAVAAAAAGGPRDGEAGAPFDRPPARIALTIGPRAPIARATARAAVEETASIWRRYGVDVVLQPSAAPAPPVDRIVIDVVVASQHADSARAALGAIAFSPDGRPTRVITIFYEDVVRFGNQPFGSESAEPSQPAARREQMIARVLGRVIAHEIGHYLLGAHAHARSGLMRAVQDTSDLAMGPTKHFLLSTAQANRLARLFGRGGLTERRSDRPTRPTR